MKVYGPDTTKYTKHNRLKSDITWLHKHQKDLMEQIYSITVTKKQNKKHK